MNRRQFNKLAVAPFIGLQMLPILEAASPKKLKPNIIMMMVDDMGFSDPGCYGGEIDTPNINSLAEKRSKVYSIS